MSCPSRSEERLSIHRSGESRDLAVLKRYLHSDSGTERGWPERPACVFTTGAGRHSLRREWLMVPMLPSPRLRTQPAAVVFFLV